MALLIRLPGMGWGLKNDLRNASLHPDEAPNFGYSRAVVPGLLQFTPGFYSYGTLYLTSLRIVSDVTTAYTGAPKTRDGWSWTDPSKVDWDWVSRCHLAGRLLSALAGAATAVIAYLIALRIAGLSAALLAGAFIAVAPAHVVHSRFQTPDVLAAALIGAALLFAVRTLDPKEEEARLHPSTWCGVFAGLSAGVKYTGILVLLALYAALALSKRPSRTRESLVATAVALGVFILTTPGILLDSEAFLKGLVYEMRHTATGQELFFTGTANGFAYHLSNLWIGIGLVLTTMGLAGLAWAAFRRQAWAWVLIAFGLPYYLLIGRAEVKFMRYTFPLYVGLAAGFGYAVAAAQRRKGWDKAAVAATIVGLGGFPGGGVHDTLPLTLGMAREDPRDAAGRFLRTDPKSVGLARDPWYWSASLVPDGSAPRSFWPAIRAEIETSSTPAVRYIVQDGHQTYFDLALFDLKPERIAVTNFEMEYPLRLRDRRDLASAEAARVEAANRWYDRLRKEYAPERTFANSPVTYGIEDMDYVRPQVIVWKRTAP